MLTIETALLIIIGILIFELLIFSHEFGHFITAKLSGVKVNEFALGMGPRLLKFKKGETEYSLRLFPIGGFCAMEGEDEESDSPDAFGNAKVWKRMIIVCAGAVMNIILGLLLVFCIQVQTDTYSTTKIVEFTPSSYTARSGLEKGDIIRSINGYKIYCGNDLSFSMAMIKPQTVDGRSLNVVKEKYGATLANAYMLLAVDEKKFGDNWAEIKEIYSKASIIIDNSTDTSEIASTYEDAFNKMTAVTYADGTEAKKPNVAVSITDESPRFRADVEVLRNGEKIMLKDVDFYTYLDENEKPAVAFDFYVDSLDRTVGTVISTTASTSVSIVRMIWKSITGLLTGQFGMNDVSGPVGVVSAVTTVAQSGLETSFLDALNNIIYIMALLSLNLGIFNMLPVPALDGGRFFFLLIEAIRRKPIPQKYEGLIHGIGFAILIVFILIVTVNDVVRLFNGTGLF